MALYQRKDLATLFSALSRGEVAQVYLVFGERYLCRDAIDQLVARLLPDESTRKNQLQLIDGDQEDFQATLHMLRTYSLFPGRRVFRITDSRLFFSKAVAQPLWEKATQAHGAGKPDKAARYISQMREIAGLSPTDFADDPLAGLSAARWKELFGFARPEGDLNWTKELAAERKNKRTLPSADGALLLTDALEAGLPPDHILILSAEAVDKRKKLFKFLEQHGVVIDLSVDAGGSSAARKDQEQIIVELVEKTLATFNKKIAPRAREILLERVGFHPVAAVLETEKLALSVGDAPTISPEDLDAVIGRTREEALYELTEAYTRQRLDQAMLIIARLQENGIHALAILATLRNHIRKLLVIRSFQLQRDPGYSGGISFPAFQKEYLPRLKEAHQEWAALWKGHPYALYMQFQQAEKFSCSFLQSNLRELLAAEYRLKGSAVAPSMVLDSLLMNLIQHRHQ